MRENRFLILSSEVSDFVSVNVFGQPAVLNYARLVASVEELASAEAAALFAEPVLPRGGASQASTISWYVATEGRALELRALDAAARGQVTDRLADLLNRLAPALRDPSVGPLVAAALMIPSNNDILVVGDQPLLVNWGYLPNKVYDPVGRNAHFASTLGRFAPALAPLVAGDLAGEPPRPVVDPTPPPTVSGQTQIARSNLTPTVVDATRVTDKTWTTPAIATTVAALAAFLLFIPGVLVYPDQNDGTGDFEAERLARSNDSLAAQLRALQNTAKDRVCRSIGVETIPVPNILPGDQKPADGPKGRDKPEARMEPVPRPPERVPLKTVPGDSASAKNVAELLDKSVVLVWGLSPKKDMTSQGSGFFISDKYIVTNRHVIAPLDENFIFVASPAQKTVRRARLIAKTPPSEAAGTQVDLAVLEIDPISSTSVLKLGITPPKLSTAYVAGFPGFLTNADSAFGKMLDEIANNLRQGDFAAALGDRQVPVPGVDLRYGRINNIMKTGPSELPVIVHDMQLAPGNSGGPLVDACGRVGGINTFILPSGAKKGAPGGQQGNFAEDVGLIRKFLDEKQIAFTPDDTSCDPSATAQLDPPAGKGTQPPQPSTSPPAAEK